ncbi:probable jasmonic acid carboxyl methyltransferase 2 [Argentina anserina]|uniref:probable jasmonic acid carboxyl methyltransferase 2 n=1 Tax=Argentina anserina TaxID=57926 RepID=UPI0021769345|nr:probable jasmonic acid carboxyl methyltransferase 2 [Potentilla anserina]
MEVVQVLHMNKGNGEASYAQNSKVQNKILTIAKPIIEEALFELLGSNNVMSIESMGIADLGCSSGPNALLIVSEIVDYIHAQLSSGLLHPSSSSVEFRVFLNDLFSNDFNTVFMSLPAFYNKLREDDRYKRLLGANHNLFISAVPGSFYGRLFARKSLHFVHSSSSLHWLSQVPPSLDSKAFPAPNKGKIYISKSSPQSVLDAYSRQFQEDFSMFLKSRAEEIVGGGRMVLSFMGRPTLDPTTEQSCYQWELLALALMSMVSDGLVAEEKVDSFNAPYYAPCAEELKLELQKDGSFILDRLEAFEIDWDGGADVVDDHQAIPVNGYESVDYDQMVAKRGNRVAKTIRAVVESMIEAHFGTEIMDELFRRYAELVTNHLSKTRTKYINLVISLIRRN